MCAEPLEWLAYGSCGHKDACSKCVARLRFVLQDKRCVICQQQSSVVVITRNMGSFTPVFQSADFDNLRVRLSTRAAEHADRQHMPTRFSVCVPSHRQRWRQKSCTGCHQPKPFSMTKGTWKRSGTQGVADILTSCDGCLRGTLHALTLRAGSSAAIHTQYWPLKATGRSLSLSENLRALSRAPSTCSSATSVSRGARWKLLRTSIAKSLWLSWQARCSMQSSS